MKRARSEAAFERAQKRIPGGVNSPVRAFRGVGGTPLFIERGEGSQIFDVDGNSFIDYVCSWGPLILGHRPPCVIDAVREVLEGGTSIEMVRLVNSGTEATMSALRLARGFTGRDLTIKFEGCYHGHVDSLLVKAGSGMATLGIADTAGVTAEFAATTIALPFNSIAAVERAFEDRGKQIAAAIVEPIVGNMGCVPPAPGFLEALRVLTSRYGALLIFDEVMTGFRVAPGGAQQLYKIRPDLTTLGKIVGGGLPLAAYGGRADIMQKIAPLGPVYQAGTLSGNPLAVAAGLATLRYLSANPDVYDVLEARGAQLSAWTPPGVTINRVGSMFTFFFNENSVTDWESAKVSDTARFGEFFHFMLERGVYLAPSQFEAGFISFSHSEDDIRHTVEAAREFFAG
jgi:glutamate-1-semialdehyde 2,1-aminomutase